MDLLGLFLEGVLSFLSPCVLPLIPLYMSYLSSDYKEVSENGDIKYDTLKVFLMTVFFVLGISTVFLLLALSVDTIKPFISNYQEVISIIGGTILILFGLHETGLIKINIIDIEKRINLNIDLKQMSFLKAYLLGLTFSFAWSPCIGPMLASAILLASTESLGSLYILIYGLGLIIPFLLTGLFTSFILNFLKKKKNIMKYVTIVAGIILIMYGCNMIYKNAKEISSLKNASSTTQEETTSDTTMVPDKYFYDQDGNAINLRDYNGKYVMLNFIATWCNYCINEIPEYLEFSSKHDDIVCFYVMSPTTSNVSKEEILEFIEEKGINVQVLIDEDNTLYSLCSPSGFPSLYVVDIASNILGYISGAMDSDGFESLYQQITEAE